jgi:hypothetical protein
MGFPIIPCTFFSRVVRCCLPCGRLDGVSVVGPTLISAIPHHVIALTTSAFPAFHLAFGATLGLDGAILVGPDELGVDGWIRETALFPHTACSLPLPDQPCRRQPEADVTGQASARQPERSARCPVRSPAEPTSSNIRCSGQDHRTSDSCREVNKQSIIKVCHGLFRCGPSPITWAQCARRGSPRNTLCPGPYPAL